ncbi:hypothetical protein [Saccharopolyspora shandongensis]|uniref:hypothetical protein n=1 Tax=Saccharopolyspora shandongensis TaxID=418495 RepID=UPI00340624C7
MIPIDYGTENPDADTWADQDGEVHAAGISAEDSDYRQALEKQQDQEAEERCGQPDDGSGDGEKAKKKSAATMLVEIAEELYEFGISPAGDVFALPRTGPRVVAMLRGGKTSLRALLSREFYKRFRTAASASALADAMLVLQGLAEEQEEVELHQRVAEAAGAFWLDLGDTTGRAVRINGDGWSIENQAPVYFRRTNLNSPLPTPVPGGDINNLWSWLNVSPVDRPLVLAWMVAALMPDFPHPALALTGEQGTGKTTATKVAVRLVDHSPVPARKPPKDMESWVTAASASWVVGLDNLSGMPEWLSDSLCRAVTGDGDVRRKLYSDGDTVAFSFRRALVLNGIDFGALRGDLAERLLSVGLEVIPDTERREEGEFWPMWDDAHPWLLGALLELAVKVLAVMPAITLPGKPRMADFARVLAAVDKAMGTKGFEHYMGLQARLAADGLSGSPLYVVLSEHITEEFAGTAGDLLTLLENAERAAHDAFWRAPKGWPTSKRQVGGMLRRLAPQMRKVGWEVKNQEDKHRKTTVWTLIPPQRRTENTPQTPARPQGETFPLATADFA